MDASLERAPADAREAGAGADARETACAVDVRALEREALRRRATEARGGADAERRGARRGRGEGGTRDAVGGGVPGRAVRGEGS